MAAKRQLSASLEDYLEAIYLVIEEKGAARSKDVVQRLSVAASSVTNALQNLAKRGLVHYEPYDLITLTAQGKKVASAVVRRHEVLTDFFTQVLSVGKKTATDCACKMEHVVSDVVLDRLVEYVKYEKRSHPAGTHWVEGTGFVCGERGAVETKA